ncbi:MAG: sugar phosphate isomerase/epimerase [Saprospiraceae bacterium]
MKLNRRKFINSAGLAAAGALVLPQWACQSGDGNTAAAAAETAAATVQPSLQNFGIQLYTVRDVLPADPKGTIKQLADFGYKQVESYEGDQGIFWGMGHTGFKQYLDGLGMTCVSSHCDIKKDFEQKAAQAAEIGMKYLICPWVGPQKSLDDFKKIAEDFNAKGDICKANGIRFAYHNHWYSFEELEGQLPQDVLMANTNPDTVDFEMDIYWVVTPGADPVAWLQKYPNRWRLCHVKDRKKGAQKEDHEASCDLGTGQIDFAKILKVAKEIGMQYYIVEQEKYENSTPMQSARADAEYLKKLVFS